MDAIIPVFLHANDPFAGEFPKFESIMNAARKAAEVRQIQRVHIASDDARVLSAATNSFFNPIFTCREKCDQALPPFTKNILEELHALGFNGEFMFVNFRNPLLTSDLLQEAVERFRSTPTNILLSAVKPKDHPCQAKSAYDLRLAGRLWGLSECYKTGRLGTAAFKARNDLIEGEIEPKGMASLVRLGSEHFYLEINDSIFYYARELSQKCNFDLPLAGFCTDEQICPSGLLFKTPEGAFRLAFNSAKVIDESCELIITAGTGIETRVREHHSSNGVIWYDFDLGMPQDNLNVIYRLISPSLSPDRFDIRVSVSMEKAPWECETFTNRSVNLETIREISGRHDFPKIFEPDTSFCITDSLQALENGLENADFELYILKPEESLTINSAFDVLRLNALRKTMDLGDLSEKAA